jgi:hypothetical protein
MNENSGSTNDDGGVLGEETDTAILQMVAEDEAEEGDGGDSDVEGGEINLHNEAMMAIDRRVDELNRSLDNDLDFGELGEAFEPAPPTIPGTPNGWTPPGPPENFWGYLPKLDAGAPLLFSEVDNPSGWSEFVFQPKYAMERGRKKYVGHVTPAGAKVLPANDDGIREHNGWRFYYQGWKPDHFDAANFARGTATKDCLKPTDQKGSLDADRLRQHGLTPERMKSDPIFFLQLLLPICNPKCSGVDGDERMPFFTTVTANTNGYAISEKGCGSGYGHEFKLVTKQELVRWLGVTIRHGARDGNAGTHHRRWLTDGADYDRIIANNMTLTQWRQIKGVFKLNNNLTTPIRGNPGYDPASKYDLIFWILCHNMNHITLWAELDLAGDESTWGFMGFMGIMGCRLMNKKVTVDEKNRMSFRHFRLRLSEQMLSYDSQNQSYKGDEAFRAVTKLSKQKREVKAYWKGENGGVNLKNFKIAKSSSRHSPSRLCGPLDDLDRHIRTLV